jgi:hypothetical protein
MSLFLAWVIFPVVVLALATGCGLLAERASGRSLPGPLLIPLGLAVIIVAAGAATVSAATARLATPLVVVLAVLGFGLSFPWRRRLDPWALVAGGGAFAAYAAPIVLSGNATFAGYITLDDTATWLALTDRVMQHGRSVAGLAPSTYQQVLTDYLKGGYPVGAEMVIGVGSQLTRQDPAWVFQPAITVFAAALALTIYVLAGTLVSRLWLRAVVAVIGAQSALLFAYAFWAGMKELAAAAMIALVCAIVVNTIADWRHLRGAVPAALAAAALTGVLSPAGLVWLVVPTALCVLALARSGLASLVAGGWRVLVAVAVLSVPSLLIGYTFLHGAANDELTSSTEVANLGHPLSVLQMIGVWPATDFRLRPHDGPLAYLLMGLVCASALFCAWFAIRRRSFDLTFYGLTGVGGILIAFALQHVGFGSPWLSAKAMAEGSPAILALALAGGAVVFETGRRTEGAVICGLIAAGVLWSNALAYSNVWLAPRAELTELQTIGSRFAGDGPTLMSAYQPYGVRHFLRGLDPEGASERRRRLIPLLDGQSLAPGLSADLDQFQPNAIQVYRTIVLRRSPVESRPPSNYSLVWRGQWYEVWQRAISSAGKIKEHLGLGTDLDPAAVPSCTKVRAMGQRAASNGGELATVLRPESPVVSDLDSARFPSSWEADSSDGTVVPHGSGNVSLSVTVPARGRYGLWLGGSFRRTMTTLVDGRRIGAVGGHLNDDGQWTPLGTVPLNPGAHTIVLEYGGSRLAPGVGGAPFGFGPLVLSTTTADLPVHYVSASDAQSLCGRRLDWLEVVGG